MLDDPNIPRGAEAAAARSSSCSSSKQRRARIGRDRTSKDHPGRLVRRRPTARRGAPAAAAAPATRRQRLRRRGRATPLAGRAAAGALPRPTLVAAPSAATVSCPRSATSRSRRSTRFGPTPRAASRCPASARPRRRSTRCSTSSRPATLAQAGLRGRRRRTSSIQLVDAQARPNVDDFDKDADADVAELRDARARRRSSTTGCSDALRGAREGRQDQAEPGAAARDATTRASRCRSRTSPACRFQLSRSRSRASCGTSQSP